MLDIICNYFMNEFFNSKLYTVMIWNSIIQCKTILNYSYSKGLSTTMKGNHIWRCCGLILFCSLFWLTPNRVLIKTNICHWKYCRFVTVLDQLDARVERFRKDALGLQEKRDFLLMSIDLIKSNDLLHNMNECKFCKTFYCFDLQYGII